jgi:peptidoglycan/xylan/chitin deacetylase (PgdA/CDA1 family)
VSPGRVTHLVVLVKGPLPSRRVLTVTVPPPLRVTASRRTSAGLVVQASSPLRRRPRKLLCGTDKISFLAAEQVQVAKSPQRCRARLRLTAEDGEQAVVPVSIPALPEIPLYSFARPAGHAIYITVDDGWTPSPQVLDIMRRTHLPVTAFLIEQAAQRDLPYWRAFVSAGGTIGDHTVSHPELTKLTLSQATTQWGQARQVLGRWLGRAPLMGRPPYGAFDPTVQAAAYRGGLKDLVGWSATVANDRIQTWNGKRLEAGEIVLLHWLPGLGHQMTLLLAAIHARHLHPAQLTPASFAGATPQRHSLSGD